MANHFLNSTSLQIFNMADTHRTILLVQVTVNAPLYK